MPQPRFRDLTANFLDNTPTDEPRVRVIDSYLDVGSALVDSDILFVIANRRPGAAAWKTLKTASKTLVCVSANECLSGLEAFFAHPKFPAMLQRIGDAPESIFVFTSAHWFHLLRKPYNGILTLNLFGRSFLFTRVRNWERFDILDQAYEAVWRGGELCEKVELLTRALLAFLPEDERADARRLAEDLFPCLTKGPQVFRQEAPIRSFARLFFPPAKPWPVTERALILQLLTNLATVFTHTGRADLLLTFLMSDDLPSQIVNEDFSPVSATQLVRTNEKHGLVIGAFTEAEYAEIREELPDLYIRLRYRAPCEILIACLDMASDRFAPRPAVTIGMKLMKRLMTVDYLLKHDSDQHGKCAQALAGTVFQIYSAGGRVWENLAWLQEANKFAQNHLSYAAAGGESRSQNYLMDNIVERGALFPESVSGIPSSLLDELAKAQTRALRRVKFGSEHLYPVKSLALAAAFDALQQDSGARMKNDLEDSLGFTQVIAQLAEGPQEAYLGGYTAPLSVVYWRLACAAADAKEGDLIGGAPGSLEGLALKAVTQSLARLDELHDPQRMKTDGSCRIMTIVELKVLLCHVAAGHAVEQAAPRVLRARQALAKSLPDDVIDAVHAYLTSPGDAGRARARKGFALSMRLPY